MLVWTASADLAPPSELQLPFGRCTRNQYEYYLGRWIIPYHGPLSIRFADQPYDVPITIVNADL